MSSSSPNVQPSHESASAVHPAHHPFLYLHPLSHYERRSTKLNKTRRQVTGRSAVAILSTHPYNRSRSHHIRRLEGVPAGEGQYRLLLGRWRFRYDIAGRVVLMTSCGRCREDTY